MPEPQSLSRQQKIGGALGIALLGFALVYRFFPAILLPDGDQPTRTYAANGSAMDAPMGFDPHAAGAVVVSEANAGPPISLASSEVIMAYRRSANAAPGSQVAQWLEQGDQALAAGRLAAGEGTASHWYAQALRADEGNRAAQAGLAEVARKLSSQADEAMARGNTDQAQSLLETLRRVPLAEVDAARVARQLKVLTQVAPMLSQAATLLQGGSVSAENRQQAMTIYRKVRELDPDNVVARQGLLKVQSYWIDRALAAVATNDYEQADTDLAQAAEVLEDSQALQNARSRVQRMRSMGATSLLAQANTALDSGDLALARKLADQALAVSADVPGMAQFDARYRNAQVYAGYRPGQSFRDAFVDRAGNAPRMVVLPTGHFMMGGEQAEHASPQHQVAIAYGVAMAATEVTVDQFGQFVDATGYRTDAERLGDASVYDSRSGRMHERNGVNWRDNYAGHRANGGDPVVNVSFNDAQAYAAWLSARTGQHYRLPSEAEFEYALRGGTQTLYWWGDGPPTRVVENVTGARDRSRKGRRWIRSFADYGDGYWGPAPVAKFAANPFGLHDMNGNVSEWTADCWHDNYTRAPRDGSAWVNPGCGMRVVRGGSWGSAPTQVHSAFRIGADAALRSGRVGFRVVRELSPAP